MAKEHPHPHYPKLVRFLDRHEVLAIVALASALALVLILAALY